MSIKNIIFWKRLRPTSAADEMIGFRDTDELNAKIWIHKSSREILVYFKTSTSLWLGKHCGLE